MNKNRVWLIVGLIFSLTACQNWWSKDQDAYNPYEGMSAKQLYAESQAALAKEQYANAAKRLEAMDTMYPFSDYAEEAQLKLIYAYYKSEDYPSTAATAEHFIHLYPRARRVDYAYYMKGLANFRQPRGSLGDRLPLDESWRDPGTQSQAYSDFATLIQKFPESKYRPNALQRMIYLRNMFAKRELNTAEFYFERKMYVAALDRATAVVRAYPQSPSAQKALLVVHNANNALGLHQAAEEAMVVYRATYPTKLA